MRPKNVFLYLNIFAKGYLRSRIGLFFSLIFPVILILLFGAIFSQSSSSVQDLYVMNMDHNSHVSQQFLEALNNSTEFTVHMVSPSVGDFQTWLNSQGYSVGLLIPNGFQQAFINYTVLHITSPTLKVTIYDDPAQGASSAEAQFVIWNVLNGFNSGAANAPLLYSYTTQGVAGPFQYIDYLIPGLIGFAVLTSPMFATVNISSEYKKTKLFRQLTLTPLTRGEWLTAAIIWFVFLTAISTVLMVGIGTLVFNARVTLTLLAIPFVILGPLFFVSLGLVAGSATNSPESAAVVGNLITFPMMFLSGTFFPVSMFPNWLKEVAYCLPLYYVIDGLNNAMIYNNTGHVLTDTLIVLVLAIVTFLAAIRVFKWREK
jgi:ABC-2 type transport system permease protein